MRETESGARQQISEIEAIYAHAPVGLCVVDSDLRFVRMNERLAEINGVSVARHLGRTVREVLPDLAENLEPLFRSVLDTGEPLLQREIHGATPAQPGVERDWLASYYPLKDGRQGGWRERGGRGGHRTEAATGGFAEERGTPADCPGRKQRRRMGLGYPKRSCRVQRRILEDARIRT